jgi:hypothetical protein
MSSDIIDFINNNPWKYKGYPATYHTVGTRRYRSTLTRFPDSRKGWMAGATPLPLYPREEDLLPIVQEAGWVSGLFWMNEKSLPHRDLNPG